MFSLKVHALEHPSKEALDAMLNSDVPADDGSTDQPAISGSASKDGGTSEDGVDGVVPTDDGITKTIKFSSGNPRVEATRGIMHLYRDTKSEPGSLEKLPVQICLSYSY
jgi:hypothetical protein